MRLGRIGKLTGSDPPFPPLIKIAKCVSRVQVDQIVCRIISSTLQRIDIWSLFNDGLITVKFCINKSVENVDFVDLSTIDNKSINLYN